MTHRGPTEAASGQRDRALLRRATWALPRGWGTVLDVDRPVTHLVVVCLLLAAAVFVFRGLVLGRLPAGAVGLTDARNAAGPWVEAITSGRIPLWQPSPAPGGPGAILPAAQAFHPLRLLHVPFGATPGLVLLLVTQLALFGAGVYALARTLGRTSGASLLAALGAELSPLLAGAAADPAVFAPLCLFPWPVVFALRASRDLRLVDAALTGALVGAIVLAGSFELAGAAAIASGLALAGGLARGGARLAALAVAAGAIALLLPAVQWLPFIEAATGGLLGPSAAGPMPNAGDLLRLALPFTGAEPPHVPGVTDPWAAAHLLHTLYLGGPILLLAFVRPGHGGENRLLVIAIVLGGIAAAPFGATIAARLLPGLGVIDPVTLSAPALLALPLLAAFGVDALTVDRRFSPIRKPIGPGRLALGVAVSLLASVAIALCLFAIGAGILLSLSVAWLLSSILMALAAIRGLGAIDAAARRSVLIALVVADLGGVQLLDSPLLHPVEPATIGAARLDAVVDFQREPPAVERMAGRPVGERPSIGDDRSVAAGPTDATTRVAIAARHEIVSRGVAVALARAPAFDPSLLVLLEEAPPKAIDGGPGSARITRDDPEEVHVQADAPVGGWLFMADRWAPGWIAWVDGIPAEVLRANGDGRAIALPPGHHQVDLRYQPASRPAGLALTATGVVVFALALARGRRRGRRGDPFGNLSL